MSARLKVGETSQNSNKDVIAISDIRKIFKKLINKDEIKNENVKRLLRVIESKKYPISVTEAGEMCGVNRRYFERYNTKLWNYRVKCPEASDKDIKWVNARREEMWLEGYDDPREIMGVMMGHILKYEYKLLGHLTKKSAIIKAGSDVLKLMVQIKTKKTREDDKKKGTSISANSKAFKSLMVENKKVQFVDKLFNRENGYKVGQVSKRFCLTDLGEGVLKSLINRTTHDIFRISRDRQLSTYIKSTTNLATYSDAICYSVCGTFTLSTSKKFRFHHGFLNVNNHQLTQLSITSLLHVLYNIVTFDLTTNSLVVSTNNLSVVNPSLGRTYNILTMFKSSERFLFRKCDYDISAALQAISLNYINASKVKYPILYKYTNDPEFKQNFRADISNELNIPTKKVKTDLTAFANGKLLKSDSPSHRPYLKFAKESERLRREFMAKVYTNEPELLKSCISQTKREIGCDIDWTDTTSYITGATNRKLSSVYFFAWTYFERLIRKSMMELLPDAIEVHDAVYSDINIDPKLLIQKVYTDTGFMIDIGQECA